MTAPRGTSTMVAVFVHHNDLRGLVVHESSHVVVAARLGMTVTAVEVEDLDGYTHIPNFNAARPSVRLCVLMAGTEAEREFIGEEMPTRPIATSDQQRVADVLLQIDRREWSSALAQARQQARRMVRVDRGAIFQVVTALLERCVDGTAVLDGERLAALLDADGSAILRRRAAV